MKVEIEGMENAQVFYGLAKDGRLVMMGDAPMLFSNLADAIGYPDEHPVRVYVVVVEDD
jgi:hypothetical protein